MATQNLMLGDCMESDNTSTNLFKKGNQLFKGRKHSEETKQKIRDYALKNNPMHNKSSKDKRSKTIIDNKLFSGENNPMWNGGCKNYRGIGWIESKVNRLKIDKYTCQSCGCTNDEKRTLDVHHIKSYKDGGTNDIDNLITLCRSCHNKQRRRVVK